MNKINITFHNPEIGRFTKTFEVIHIHENGEDLILKDESGKMFTCTVITRADLKTKLSQFKALKSEEYPATQLFFSINDGEKCY